MSTPITAARLTRAAGMSAVAAGLLFIVVHVVQPYEDVATVTTTAWRVTHILGLAMAGLALVGISGMYLRQVTQTGRLGLIGFVLFGSFFLLITGSQFVEAFVLPSLADQAPQFVSDFLAIPTGGVIVGEVWALVTVNLLTGATYVFGGLLFGVALFRAGILARWAALLLAAGTALALLLPLLPNVLDRLTGVPVGVALAGLGFSLWREQRTAANDMHTPSRYVQRS
ncbi:hypothetical protein [Pseudonocardia broussonetiae]|uniref:DUF4386 family protein n=1 Tax=Pseudonocardia broussonetiae TaxID=2736640 RepID=A0A6M6JPA6_9PSEU|nr:hypothetical protein [Pseudonocardia broussonetiae]QJY49010.1 hypothetical protein HOP40_27200 [Pseudonocardia broussonetiae]